MPRIFPSPDCITHKSKYGKTNNQFGYYEYYKWINIHICLRITKNDPPINPDVSMAFIRITIILVLFNGNVNPVAHTIPNVTWANATAIWLISSYSALDVRVMPIC